MCEGATTTTVGSTVGKSAGAEWTRCTALDSVDTSSADALLFNGDGRPRVLPPAPLEKAAPSASTGASSWGWPSRPSNQNFREAGQEEGGRRGGGGGCLEATYTGRRLFVWSKSFRGVFIRHWRRCMQIRSLPRRTTNISPQASKATTYFIWLICICQHKLIYVCRFGQAEQLSTFDLKARDPIQNVLHFCVAFRCKFVNHPAQFVVDGT